MKQRTRRLRALYLGDHKNGSGRYVAAALQWAEVGFEHFDCGERPPPALLAGKREWDAVILSDYPADRLGSKGDKQLASLVSEHGVGLLMLGGWSSFTGLNGSYRGTAVSALLPVRMQAADDRRNLPTGLVLWPAASHPIVDGLNFRRPPVVVGYNAVIPRTNAEVLMNALEVRVRGRGRVPTVSAGGARPMLLVGESGRGRTAAFATDLAPHWCGGLVDWGRGRVEVGGVEVGDLYLDFIRRLVTWVAG